MKDGAVLSSERNGRIATLTLNRPQQRNALSRELLEALLKELTHLATDESADIVVLRANGPGFCAGHDLQEMRSIGSDEQSLRELFDLCARVMMSIVELPQPVVARVHGIATAAGCQLVASCDLAIASESAVFATPGVNIGLFCSTPMVALSRNVARKHAMEMLLTGLSVDAAQAARIGLVNRAVAPDSLDEEVDALVSRIAGRSVTAIRIGKRAFYRQLEMSLHDAYEYTGAVMVQNMMEEDALEGVTAFIEKRQPSWMDAT